MDDLEARLTRLTLAPYVVKATALIGVRRRGGSNMFRHQLSTFAILLDYKMTDPVLLKASVIHDLFEDAHAMPGVSEEEIGRIDGSAKLFVKGHEYEASELVGDEHGRALLARGRAFGLRHRHQDGRCPGREQPGEVRGQAVAHAACSRRPASPRSRSTASSTRSGVAGESSRGQAR